MAIFRSRREVARAERRFLRWLFGVLGILVLIFFALLAMRLLTGR